MMSKGRIKTEQFESTCTFTDNAVTGEASIQFVTGDKLIGNFDNNYKSGEFVFDNSQTGTSSQSVFKRDTEDRQSFINQTKRL